MSATAVTTDAAPAPTRVVARVRAAVAAVGAAVLGAAPHVLHHVGPLAGAALLAGATGKLLFGAVGFLLAIPMLRRLRRRTSSWRLPGAALAVMAVIFTFSSFVIGPALTGSDEPTTPSQNVPAAPPGASPGEHEAHHP
jgi:ABC-type branched-subunit amino acid transport system permease subunit